MLVPGQQTCTSLQLPSLTRQAGIRKLLLHSTFGTLEYQTQREPEATNVPTKIGNAKACGHSVTQRTSMEVLISRASSSLSRPSQELVATAGLAHTSRCNATAAAASSQSATCARTIVRLPHASAAAFAMLSEHSKALFPWFPITCRSSCISTLIGFSAGNANAVCGVKPVGKTIACPRPMAGLYRNSAVSEYNTASLSEAKDPPLPPAFVVEFARSRAILLTFKVDVFTEPTVSCSQSEKLEIYMQMSKNHRTYSEPAVGAQPGRRVEARDSKAQPQATETTTSAIERGVDRHSYLDQCVRVVPHGQTHGRCLAPIRREAHPSASPTRHT